MLCLRKVCGTDVASESLPLDLHLKWNDFCGSYQEIGISMLIVDNFLLQSFAVINWAAMSNLIVYAYTSLVISLKITGEASLSKKNINWLNISIFINPGTRSWVGHNPLMAEKGVSVNIKVTLRFVKCHLQGPLATSDHSPNHSNILNIITNNKSGEEADLVRLRTGLYEAY